MGKRKLKEERQKKAAGARAKKLKSDETNELTDGDEEEDEEEEESEKSAKSAKHAVAGKQSAEAKKKKKDRINTLNESRIRKSQNQTAAEEAEEAIVSLEQAYEVENELLEENDIHFDVFGNAMEEGGVEDPELEALKEKNQELMERQRILLNEKKAMKKRMKKLVESEKKKNKNMQRTIERKQAKSRTAKKRFTELQSRDSRLQAVTKFVTLLAGIFTCYTVDDFRTISRKAWPDTIIDVPDWIKSDIKKMWFHTVCLGLTADQSLTAADVDNYDPQMTTIENITTQVNTEIGWAKTRVQKAEKELDEALSKLNLPKEVTDLPAVNAFFKVFESFGAYRSLWFQRFTGNHIHLILKSMNPTAKRQYTLKSKLMEEEELKELFQDVEFSQGLEALKVLGEIQSLFASKVLSDDEISSLKSYISLLKNTMMDLKSVKVSHKFHLLLEHVGKVAERDKTIGFFSEHGLESLHAHVNALLKRLTIKRNENKLERILQLVNAATVNRDEHGDLLENDDEDEENDEEFPFPNDDVFTSADVNTAETIFINIDEDLV